MGKTSKWLRSFLTGKKEKDKRTSNRSPSAPTSPISVPPNDKKRWSFRRSHAKDPNSTDQQPPTTVPAPPVPVMVPADDEQRKHEMAMEEARAAAAAAALAAAEAAAAVVRLTNERAMALEEDAAATRIQAYFRSYLARKALFALKGLVKLQALVRGHLVRKQATATLRCMQALITAQERARAQRIHTVEEASQRPSSAHRKSTQDRSRLAYNEMERGLEENIKIVEMDHGEPKPRNSYSSRPPTPRSEHRHAVHQAEHGRYGQPDDYQISPSPSALTDMSPRGCNLHLKDYGFNTAQSSPQCYSAGPPEYTESLTYDYSLFPSYMANTESSRAKARSQSAPKQRNPDCFERPASRRRSSMEGRNVPRAVRMQRSSSHVGAAAQNQQYPWSIKLDRSTVSLVDSECGSTSTVLTNNYCRSVAGFDSHGNRY